MITAVFITTYGQEVLITEDEINTIINDLNNDNLNDYDTYEEIIKYWKAIRFHAQEVNRDNIWLKNAEETVINLSQSKKIFTLLDIIIVSFLNFKSDDFGDFEKYSIQNLFPKTEMASHLVILQSANALKTLFNSESVDLDLWASKTFYEEQEYLQEVYYNELTDSEGFVLNFGTNVEGQKIAVDYFGMTDFSRPNFEGAITIFQDRMHYGEQLGINHYLYHYQGISRPVWTPSTYYESIWNVVKIVTSCFDFKYPIESAMLEEMSHLIIYCLKYIPSKTEHLSRNQHNRAACGELRKVNQISIIFHSYVDENDKIWKLQPKWLPKFYDSMNYVKFLRLNTNQISYENFIGDNITSSKGNYETIRPFVTGEDRDSDSFIGENVQGHIGGAYNFFTGVSLNHFLADIVPHFYYGGDYVIYNTTNNYCNNDPNSSILVLGSVDPNDMLSPDGYGQERYLSKDKAIPYTIRFENDPVFATAPAQIITINHTLDEDINLNSLVLGDFGFAGQVFSVPENQTFYEKRLNLVDSLGIYVNVTAGIDPTNREAYWTFESIDPKTGLSPTNPFTGMLPVNDTLSHKGEGFVNFIVRPQKETIHDSKIDAEATIIFDTNEAINTPPIFNTIDNTPPVSNITSIEIVEDNNTAIIKWENNDIGAGVESTDLYISQNNNPFYLHKAKIIDNEFTFKFDNTKSYSFFTISCDKVGNCEAMKKTGKKLK